VGQYTADVLGKFPGYADDPTIANKATRTETFAVAVLAINNPRWSGVPFVLRAGKGLDESNVEVRIRFQPVLGAVSTLAQCAPNELVIRVQPDEHIYWKITSKVVSCNNGAEIVQLQPWVRRSLVMWHVLREGCRDQY